jgi:hypothetical protein
MSDRARRKEKQRLKRKQKRREIQRFQNISPYRRAAGGEWAGCWINHDWRERGQAAVWVLRRGVGGTLAMAAYFVDLWCAGLKDAWGRLDVLREEFDEARDRMSAEMDGTIAPCTLDLARQVVAGGIRFAVQNGFRLAQRYDRWTAFLGEPALDWHNASLDGFGVEDGTLRWVGPIEDLRARYIGGRLGEFLDRPDIEFVFQGDGTYFEEFDEEEDADEEEGIEAFKELAERAAGAARNWCAANGLDPQPMLVEAMAFTFAALLTSANEAKQPTKAEFQDRLKELVRDAPVEDRAGLLAAAEQVDQFVNSFQSPQAFLQSLALPDATA